MCNQLTTDIQVPNTEAAFGMLNQKQEKQVWPMSQYYIPSLALKHSNGR